jgi:hypothetical protein
MGINKAGKRKEKKKGKKIQSMDEEGCSKCMANTWELSSCKNRTSTNCYHACHILRLVHFPMLASHLYIHHLRSILYTMLQARYLVLLLLQNDLCLAVEAA